MALHAHRVHLLMKRFALVLLVCTLVSAMALQLFGVGQSRGKPVQKDLVALLPTGGNLGWSMEDLPLGNTESMQNNVEKRLNFDSFIFRRYTRGNANIAIYLAYWGPDRMDTRLVASHTPDRCWVENGWQCTDKAFGTELDVGGVQTKPAQGRTFIYPSTNDVQHVFYWHLVGDKVYDYGERLNKFPDPIQYFRDFAQQLKNGRPEQYFIRISSSIPSEQLLHEPLFEDLIASLAPIGLDVSKSVSQ